MYPNTLDGAGCYLQWKWVENSTELFSNTTKPQIVYYHYSIYSLEYYADECAKECDDYSFYYDLVFVIGYGSEESHDLSILNSKFPRSKRIFIDNYEREVEEKTPGNFYAFIDANSLTMAVKEFFEEAFGGDHSIANMQYDLLEKINSFLDKPPSTIGYALDILYHHCVVVGETKARTFYKAFRDGFRGLSTRQKNMVKEVLERFQKIIEDTEFYEREIQVGGKPCRIVAFNAEDFYVQYFQYVFDEFSPDVAILTNPKKKSVSFRRNPDARDDIDVSKLARRLCDGGGYDASAGGKITDKFLTFAKNMKEIK